MVWAGSPFAHRIEFSTGLPTGAVSYQLLGNEGQVLLDQSFAPSEGAISWLLIISGTHNGCAKPLFESRTLLWHYETTNGLVSDRLTYRVQRPIPFTVSASGVRSKLGIEPHELKDEAIDLVSAYAEFVSLFPDGTLTIHETAGDRTTILCIHAIEAIAAISLLASLQLKIAQRETSGTNEYQRFAGTDWDLIALDLAAHVDRARAAIDDTFDATGGEVFTFGTAVRTDAITGGA